MKIVYIILMLLLISCNGKKPQTNSQNLDALTTNSNDNCASIIPLEKGLLEQYNRINRNIEKDESTLKFITELTKTIENFKGRVADTTLQTFIDIDGINGDDTVSTRVYYCDTTVIVESQWKRNREIMWTDTIINPYLYISQHEAFAYDTRSPWVTFEVGLKHSSPTFENINHYKHISTETALNMASSDMKGIDSFDSSAYGKYLSNYNGMIMLFGEPESPDGLKIWYEPMKQFILFYKP